MIERREGEGERERERYKGYIEREWKEIEHSYKNYVAITMSRNYYRKLSASIYHHTKNVGIVGILAYPKMILIF